MTGIISSMYASLWPSLCWNHTILCGSGKCSGVSDPGVGWLNVCLTFDRDMLSVIKLLTHYWILYSLRNFSVFNYIKTPDVSLYIIFKGHFLSRFFFFSFLLFLIETGQGRRGERLGETCRKVLDWIQTPATVIRTQLWYVVRSPPTELLGQGLLFVSDKHFWCKCAFLVQSDIFILKSIYSFQLWLEQI